MENQKLTSISRRAANSANAKKSTGPRTPEGKRKSSLNALRHGLTSHLVVLPTEDLAAYQTFLAKCHNMFHPATDQELELVDTLANTRWRLNRCSALEAGLFALGHEQDAPADDVEAAFSAALTFQESADTFLKLSIYEQRLMRTYQITKKELFLLQESRRAVAKAEYEDFKDIRKLCIQKGRIFDSTQYGFVSQESVVDGLIRRRDAVRSGYLAPENPPEPRPLAA